MKSRIRFVCLISIVLLANPAVGDVIFVDDDAPPGGDGQSWSTAFRFLADALNFVSPSGSGISEIRVAQGTYAPDRDASNSGGSGSRAAAFALRPNLVVSGGFAGLGAAAPDEQDFEAFPSILTGDLLGNDDAAQFTLADNSLHVIVADGVDATAVLDGFVVERGFVDPTSPIIGGAGMLLTNSNCLVRNCLFRHHRLDANTSVGTGGVGLRILSGAPTISDCRFEDNRAIDSWVEESLVGGAIMIDYQAGAVQVLRCGFENNEAARGGGVANAAAGAAIQHCRFVGNRGSGGGIYTSGFLLVDRCAFHNNDGLAQSNMLGGAIRTAGHDSLLVLQHCLFQGNTAPRGGALFVGGALEARNCLFFDNRAIGASARGGAILIFEQDVTVSHCTIVNNSAQDLGGGIHIWTGGLNLSNSILWNDAAGEITNQYPAFPVVNYCNIEGGWAGTGNLNAAPLFVDAPQLNFRLLPASPCIDRGGNAWVTVTHDFDGRPRVLDGDANGSAVTDIGAFEYTFLDCNANGIDDGVDLHDGLSVDLNANGIPDECKNAPPVCLPPLPVTLWPPNHHFHTLDLARLVEVIDPDGDEIDISITAITQDEPVNDLADGTTACDGAGLGASVAQIRAERTGGGNGRVYRIAYDAADGAGGICHGALEVHVPHSPNQPSIDDGQKFDSTSCTQAADLNGDARVNSDDLLIVIANWGEHRSDFRHVGPTGDCDHNRKVDVSDLWVVLANWD